jgi:hypothetical protein
LLRDGKLPKRKGLIKNVCYLIGLGKWYNRIENSGCGSKCYDRLISFSLKIPKNTLIKPAFVVFLKNFLEKNISNYFGDCIIDMGNIVYGKINIEYKSKEVKWYLIDFDLKNNHAFNTFIKPNGCICVVDLHVDTENAINFYKSISIINEKAKIDECIEFLENNGYKVFQVHAD